MVRIKQRYLLAQMVIEKSNVELQTRDIYSSLTARITQLLGVFGFGAVKASLAIKYWNQGTGFVLVRIGRAFVRPMWTALSSVREMAGRRCVMSVVHCGGTIRGAKLAQLRLLRLRQMCA